MHIRPLQADDVDPVMNAIRETGMFHPEEETVAQELIDIFLTQPEQRDYVVDVVEDEAGVVQGYVCYGPTPMTEGTIDLYWIAVHPGTQGKGFGKALVRRVEDYTREKKGRLVVIETSSKDKYAPTRHFYQRLGYQETARIRDFYRPGDDRVIYCKYL